MHVLSVILDVSVYVSHKLQILSHYDSELHVFLRDQALIIKVPFFFKIVNHLIEMCHNRSQCPLLILLHFHFVVKLSLIAAKDKG